jgi:hypothetical protein
MYQLTWPMGNPADTAPSKGCISKMGTTGEIGMKPTSPQARVLPVHVLYVLGTYRRCGFSTECHTEGNRTAVPRVQGAFKPVQPG